MDGHSDLISNPGETETVYQRRARYYSPANIFTVKRPPVPCHVFAEEAERALATDAPTGWMTLDIGARMGFDYAATTPLLLARYARLRAGERLTGQFRSSGELYYVIRGSGRAAKAGDAFDWAAGDIFALPGGGETELAGGPEGAVLLQITNEPELVFHGLAAPSPDASPTETVHYPDAEIRRQMALVHDSQKSDPNASGMAMHFSSERREALGDIHPSIALAVNSLDAHANQRPHRHNSVALTLPIDCAGVYSVIEGERVDWRPYALMITPPAALHEHRNEGDHMMRSLVVQDGSLYYHLRTIGFSFG